MAKRREVIRVKDDLHPVTRAHLLAVLWHVIRDGVHHGAGAALNQPLVVIGQRRDLPRAVAHAARGLLVRPLELSLTVAPLALQHSRSHQCGLLPPQSPWDSRAFDRYLMGLTLIFMIQLTQVNFSHGHLTCSHAPCP